VGNVLAKNPEGKKSAGPRKDEAVGSHVKGLVVTRDPEVSPEEASPKTKNEGPGG